MDALLRTTKQAYVGIKRCDGCHGDIIILATASGQHVAVTPVLGQPHDCAQWRALRHPAAPVGRPGEEETHTGGHHAP